MRQARIALALALPCGAALGQSWTGGAQVVIAEGSTCCASIALLPSAPEATEIEGYRLVADAAGGYLTGPIVSQDPDTRPRVLRLEGGEW